MLSGRSISRPFESQARPENSGQAFLSGNDLVSTTQYPGVCRDELQRGQPTLNIAHRYLFGNGIFFYNEHGFSRSMLNCMTNLHCEDKITKKNIRENPEYEKKLIALTGAKTVPVLVIDGKPLKDSEEINQFLVGKFM